jgi:hypothetical protein
MMQLQTTEHISDKGYNDSGYSTEYQLKPLLPMLANKKRELENSLKRKSFVTIDDVAHMAKELLDKITALCECRHPLDIRRGVGSPDGEGNTLDINETSRVLRVGAKAYFFDLRKTKDGQPYLSITESRPKEMSAERERRKILVFANEARRFGDAVAAMIARLI